jgi:hypothetical protein
MIFFQNSKNVCGKVKKKIINEWNSRETHMKQSFLGFHDCFLVLNRSCEKKCKDCLEKVFYETKKHKLKLVGNELCVKDTFFSNDDQKCVKSQESEPK